MDKIILHVMVVSFHHRNGPIVEYCIPPLPDAKVPVPGEAIALPDEWNYLGFICLPDGAHTAEEEYIYFHLPPIKGWAANPNPSYQKTLFGLACFRQIDAKDLLNKPADVTRSKVQKSVVVLANQCVLGSVRSKLGLVTQAYFAQRDFSKVELIDNLYENLNSTLRMPISDATLFMGLSLRELVFKFKQKTLQLFKLLLLGKRILFYGHKVERLSAYQYSLISLIPELLRNLHDVGAAELDNFPVILPVIKTSSLEDKHRSMDNLRSHQIDAHKAKLLKLGHPLRIFGEKAFFQPYIPLQQIQVLESKDTTSFLTGTSNFIFTHHKSCNIDVVAHADTGNLEIINPSVNPLIGLTSADKKFIDDIIKPVVNTWKPDGLYFVKSLFTRDIDDMSQIHQIDFEGSDDDIRARFESYITQLFASVQYDENTPANDPNNKKTDYLSEYNLNWVATWKNSPSFRIWSQGHNTEYVSMILPGHPNHGTSMLDTIAASFSAFSKPSDEPSAASQLLQNVTSWYSSSTSKKAETSQATPSAMTPIQQAQKQENADIGSYENINLS